MIVLPHGFTLIEEAADTPLVNPRIGYQNYLFDLLPENVVASSETADGPPDSTLRPETHEYWEPEELPATITYDLGAARFVDYAGILAELNGCSVELYSSTNEVDYTLFSDAINPGNDDPLMFLDESTLMRWFRIRLSGTTSVMPKLAVPYVGQVLKLPRSIYSGHSPIPLSRVTETYRARSRGGQLIGYSFRNHGVAGQIQLQHLDPDWYREYFDPFVEHARGLPFFWAWRPARYPNEVAFLQTDADIAPSNMGKRGLMSVSFDVSGIGHE